MRPAFTHYLGREGAEMGEHDRIDHENARSGLLSLYTDFEALPLDHEDHRSDTSRGRERLADLARRVWTLMGELSQHMSLESGTFIPRLESFLSPEKSRQLAQQYLRTYVLSPDLRLYGKDVWPGGVGEYVRTGRERFHKLWREVQREEVGIDWRKEGKL